MNKTDQEYDVDPNWNNESIDHLRSNQARSQDFFQRNAHFSAFSSPAPLPHHHLKNPNIFDTLIKDKVTL